MTTLEHISEKLSVLVDMVVPATCHVCGCSLTKAEKRLCLHCLLEMPRTMVHKRASTRITDRLARYTPESRHASWFFYRRGGAYSRLIHDIKYRDMPRMGRELGRLFAEEILPSGFFDGIDLIVPVPLHWTRRMERGYNQSRAIAQGVSQATGISVSKTVYALRRHQRQALQSGVERMSNVRADMFGLRRPEELAGRHILIIDDVITTGTTIDAVAGAIYQQTKAGGAPRAISVLSLGLTSND